jgi:hypothetical protein
MMNSRHFIGTLLRHLTARTRRSATGQLLQMFRVPGSLHRDIGDGTLNVAEIIGSQFNASRSYVLLQPVQFRGAGDRHDPRLLSKQSAC